MRGEEMKEYTRRSRYLLLKYDYFLFLRWCSSIVRNARCETFSSLKSSKQNAFLAVFYEHATEADAGGRVALDYFTNHGGRGVSVFAKFLDALARLVRWNRRQHTTGSLWIE